MATYWDGGCEDVIMVAAERYVQEVKALRPLSTFVEDICFGSLSPLVAAKLAAIVLPTFFQVNR